MDITILETEVKNARAAYLKANKLGVVLGKTVIKMRGSNHVVAGLEEQLSRFEYDKRFYALWVRDIKGNGCISKKGRYLADKIDIIGEYNEDTKGIIIYD